MLTQGRLKELLSYDPGTGVWTRLVATRSCPIGFLASYLNSHQGYMQINIDGTVYRSCRLAFFYMTGEWPPDHVDHIDRDKTNDQWDNLRLATRSQNKANSSVYANNGLGVKGVSQASAQKSRPFRARIQVDGKPKHLGYFETPEAANIAYMKAAQVYFGEFAHNGV